MSQAIHKYAIPSSALSPGGALIEMENDARIVAFQGQNGIPTLWAICTPGTNKRKRRFRLMGTGHADDCVSEEQYLGTIQVQGLVWHCFEVLQ